MGLKPYDANDTAWISCPEGHDTDTARPWSTPAPFPSDGQLAQCVSVELIALPVAELLALPVAELLALPVAELLALPVTELLGVPVIVSSETAGDAVAVWYATDSVTSADPASSWAAPTMVSELTDRPADAPAGLAYTSTSPLLVMRRSSSASVVPPCTTMDDTRSEGATPTTAMLRATEPQST